MGKSKKGRYKGGYLAVSPVTNEVLDNQADNGNMHGKDDYLDSILEIICSSVDIEHKECALATFANLAQEKQAVLKMLQKGVVKKLGPLFADSNSAVKEKVAGTFRNMSVTGEEEACKLLVKDDIMTCIGCALRRDIPQLDQLIKSGEKAEDIAKLSASLKEIIILLWNLCEASSIAVRLFNEDHLLLPVASLLFSESHNHPLFLASVQCLYTVTEDNKDAISQLTNNSGLLARLAEMQEQVGNGKQMLVASLASGVLYNIHTNLPEATWNTLLEKIVLVTSKVLDVNLEDLLQQYQLQTTSKESDNIMDYLMAQQICFELLANMLCTDDNDDDQWEDMEASDEDIDENIDEIQEDMDSAVDQPVFNLLSSHAIPLKIVKIIKTPSTVCSISKDPELTGRFLKALNRVRKSGLVCLNNLLSVCPINMIGNFKSLEDLWLKIMELATSSTGNEDDELMDAYLGLLRAIAVKFGENNCCNFLTEQILEIFHNWYRSLTNNSTRCNLLNILGIAGKIAALKEDGLPVLEGIGKILCSAINTNNSVLVITEALDAIFDAFGENGIADSALVSTGLAKELCQLPPLLKAKVNAEKNSLKEHLAVIHMARTNLLRFIKYKQWK
eukprot:gene18875-20775_t